MGRILIKEFESMNQKSGQKKNMIVCREGPLSVFILFTLISNPHTQ